MNIVVLVLFAGSALAQTTAGPVRLAGSRTKAGPMVNATAIGNINGHTAYGDANDSNKLLSWINPSGRNNLYRYMSSLMTWIETLIPTCQGQPAYYYNPILPCGTSTPLTVASDQAATLLEAALLWNTYSGDASFIATAATFADYVYANGQSGGTWAGLPYSASTPAAAGTPSPYDGKEPVAGSPPTKTIEPGKAANLGLQYAKLYQYNTTTYAAAYTKSKAIADALVSMREPFPNGSNSPWPWRIDGQAGTVYDPFTGEAVTELRLFDELIALGAPNAAAYTTARNAARTWTLAYPVADHTKLVNYYEDTSPNIANYVSYLPLETANYLIDNPSIDASYLADAESLASFAAAQLGGTDIGSATSMAEQIVYNVPTPDGTTRWALTNAKIANAGGGAAYKDVALRAFNQATYGLVATSTGRVDTAYQPAKAIASITNPNAGTVTIVTSTAHGLATNDQARLSAIAGQTALNAVWVVTVTNGTTFTLQGTTGNGVASTGGYANFVIDASWFRVALETVIHMCKAIAIYPEWGYQ